LDKIISNDDWLKVVYILSHWVRKEESLSLKYKALNTLLKTKDIMPKECLENKFVNQITKQERRRIVEILKGLSLTITKLRPIAEAIVTAGGVEVDEINPSTMESKLIKGLHFCGEVMDLDAYTGGFNLQIAFSTGYLAGSNV